MPLLLLNFASLVCAQTIAFQRYSVSAPFTSSLGQVAAGPDGALWAVDPINGQINRVTVAGAVQSFQVDTCTPPYGCGLQGITAGPDGAVWFTNLEGTIGRITTAGVVTNEYSVPGAGIPWGITAGPDGALWFCAEFDKGNKIGRITTSGTITMYPVPHPAKPITKPQSITTGPDGALWFSENDYIGRITTAGAITVYPVTIAGTSYQYLAGITTGPDGALWFGAGQSVGRITMSGVLSYYPAIPSDLPFSVQSIVAGPDGNLWFSESGGADVYSMTTSGTIASYFPNFTTDYGGIGVMVAAGPGGTLWFSDGNTMGEVIFVTATLNVSPEYGPQGTPFTFTGSGFAPGEKVKIYSAGIGSPVVAKAVANSSGSITAAGLAPHSAWGERVFLGLGQTSGKLGAASFNMDQSLIATPNSGPPGTSVTVDGYGFYSFEPLTVTFNGIPLISLTTNIYGSFAGTTAFTFTVPENTSPGTYSITASAPYTYLPSASVTFTVN